MGWGFPYNEQSFYLLDPRLLRSLNVMINITITKRSGNRRFICHDKGQKNDKEFHFYLKKIGYSIEV